MTQPLATSQAVVSVPTGPAGRAMAEPMSAELIGVLQAHLNMERQSSAAYFAAAVWFAERELVGFAEHLRDEAKQEQEHAAKFADYLISRGQTVELDTIEPPRQQWADVEEVIATVFRMEADVTASVLQSLLSRCLLSTLRLGHTRLLACSSERKNQIFMAGKRKENTKQNESSDLADVFLKRKRKK